jgi:hypothetical protein
MSGKAIRETLGFLAVVASMVFVGVEIRQTNKLAQAAAYQAIGVASAAAWDNQAHDREFLLATQDKEAAAMDTADWRQRANKFTVWARLGETVLIQVEHGLLPPDAMERLGFAGWQGIFEEPTGACIWPLIRPGVSASFRQWVEEGKDPNAIDCSGFAIPVTLY